MGNKFVVDDEAQPIIQLQGVHPVTKLKSAQTCAQDEHERAEVKQPVLQINSAVNFKQRFG